MNIKRLIMVLLCAVGLLITGTTFADEQGYDLGVGINSSGIVVESHQSTATDQLWCDLGYYQNMNNNPVINWTSTSISIPDAISSSTSQGNPWTRVVVGPTGQLAVFFAGHDNSSQLWVAAGQIQFSNNQVPTGQQTSTQEPTGITWYGTTLISSSFPSSIDYCGEAVFPQFVSDNGQEYIGLRFITPNGFYYYTYNWNSLTFGNFTNLSLADIAWNQEYTNGSILTNGSASGMNTNMTGYDGTYWYNLVDYTTDTTHATYNSIIAYDQYNWSNGGIPYQTTLEGAVFMTTNNTQMADVSPSGQWSVLLVQNTQSSEAQNILADITSTLNSTGNSLSAIKGLEALCNTISILIGGGDNFTGIGTFNAEAGTPPSFVNGMTPTVAVNDEGWVVTVHISDSGSNNDMYSIAGYICPPNCSYGSTGSLILGNSTSL